VVLALKDNEGWDRPPHCVDALDDCSPLPVALLYALWPSSTLRACDNCSSRYHAHHEASLVKVVYVLIQDAVLKLGLLY
jgi:hypothetical protein